MKIVQVGATYYGAQKKIETAIHEYLIDHGHDSYILYAMGESADSAVISYENKLENIIRRILRKFVAKNPHFAFISTIKLLRKLSALSPDLVHLHIVHHGYLDYLLLLKYLARWDIPVVCTQHDMWWFTGGCYYYTDVGCTLFQDGCQNCPKARADLDCKPSETSVRLKEKLALFQKINKLSFVSVSDWVYRESMKSRISDFPQYVVWNAIKDTDEKNLWKRTDSDSRFRIVGVAASWGSRKGIERFIELAQKLGDQYQIVLIGTASDAIKRSAPQNITFMGPIYDKDKLNEQYALADVHVSMSMEETFGLTFIEAAIMGTKSIGFNSSAVPEVLQKIDGYIIMSNTVEEMAELIKSLNQDRQQCCLSKEDIYRIKQFFSEERMASQYVQVYENTVRMKKLECKHE